MPEPVRILYRPVGPKELELIAASGYREFPLNRNIVGLIEVIASFGGDGRFAPVV